MRKISVYCADSVVLVFAVIHKITTLNLRLARPTRASRETTAAIIGNGPSLKRDIEVILSIKPPVDLFVVNYFAIMGPFRELKPSHYFLIDPVFWSDGIDENIEKDNGRLIRELLEVDWHMELICGDRGYSRLKTKLEANRYISVVRLKSNWFDLRSKKANIFALRFSLTTPSFVNVLIAAIWYALMTGRTSIEIYGADFSAFKELQVDQTTNRVFTSSSHFYEATHASSLVKDKYVGVPPKTIDVRFYQIWLAFREMYFLSEVAKIFKVGVLNKSSFSYLDCYKRH